MRKLFKKSLACVLAVALCLTAMVGVLTVSADTLDGTIEIADVTIEAGSTTATIPVTFTVAGDEADLINTGYINYEIDGATVTRVYDSVGNLGTNTAGSMFEIWLDETGEGGAKVANANIVVEFAAETESFTLKLSNNTSATNTEKLIDFGTAEKTFTVKAAHVHNFVPTVTKDATCEEDGVKTFACECGKDTYTEAIPAIGHKWDEGVVTTAPDCDDAGVKTYTCANDDSHTKTEAINALGHTPGEAAEENRVEAKPGVAGSYDMVVRCTVCKAELSKTTHEIPALPVEPTYNGNLKFASASVGYGTSSLQMAFRVMKTVVSSYDRFEVIITPNKYNTSTYNNETPVAFVPTLVDKGNFYEYVYTNIQLYELGLEIAYELKAYKADGTVEYANYTTTPAAFLKETYGKASDAKLRTLIVDTLVVGDAAAKTWGKPTNDLGKATSIIEGFDISEATQDYGTPNSILNHTATNPDYDTPSGSARRINLGVAIGKVPYINYRIQNCKDLDITKLSVDVSYSQTTGKGTTTPYSHTFTSAEAALTKNESNGLITLAFDQVGLADGGKNITFVVKYDGQELCNTIYSIESYLGGQTGSANIGTISVALLKLSASASAYYS